MAKRKLKDYVGFTGNVRTSKMMTKATQNGEEISFIHKFKSLLDESVLAWLTHNASVTKPHPYKVDLAKTSIYDLPKGRKSKIAMAADWASDTVQSEKIAGLIRNQNADYTIHMGDTYYSGSAEETEANFRTSWPLGSVASFALLGNHEMYHGAYPYFETLLPEIFKQDNPFFCLKNDHWCILGLDTGYQSIIGKPQNTDLKFETALENWLTNTVKPAVGNRGIIVLTHHQFISAFKKESEFQNPAKSLKKIFPDNREILWIWGHEHRFSMYGKYPREASKDFITAYGRCIGHGGMPSEIREVDSKSKSKDAVVLWDSREVDSFPKLIPPFKVKITNNGYATLQIDEANLEITYYSSYIDDKDAPLVEQAIIKETWTADKTTGSIKCLNLEDLTIKNGKSELSYLNDTPDPLRAGNYVSGAV